MINRLDDAKIESLFGAEALKRLRNQTKGGTNGKDGSKFELFFCAHRIARLARKYILNREDAVIEWQSQGFVDDVVARRDDKLSIKAYQLKKSNSASWAADNGKITSDFRDQESLSKTEGYTDVRLRLVCSNKKLATTLANKIPSRIASFSKAIFFRMTSICGCFSKDTVGSKMILASFLSTNHPRQMKIGRAHV